MHSTTEGPKPVTYCTTCGTWCYDSMQGHLAKDHAQFKESSNKFPNRGKKKLRFGPTTQATPALAEDDDSDSKESASDS
eukprot:13428387-Ditylum_brightwellii.AAC.1